MQASVKSPHFNFDKLVPAPIMRNHPVKDEIMIDIYRKQHRPSKGLLVGFALSAFMWVALVYSGYLLF
jgi:hypothetical protein